MNKHYIALDFDKVLENLSTFAGSEEGKELCVGLEPESNFSLAQSQLDRTEAAHSLMARYGGPSFGGIRNVNGILARAFAGGVLNMGELLKVASVLKAIRNLVEWRDQGSGTSTVLDSLFDSLSPNKYFEDKITNAIISEDEMSDNASAELKEIRRKIRVAMSKVRDKLDQMVHSGYYQKFLREPIVTQRNGRYVVPVKIEHRGEIKGLVHDTSSSGSTVFIEPAGVVESNNEIKVLQSRERDEIERILEEFSVEAGSFYETIKLSCECAVELDVIFAKARYAYSIEACMPELNDCGRIDLKKARHPLISKDKVVPINISLGIDFDTLVITGPNTGGKTVSIKTLGLLSLMAMTGMMVPALEGSEISVFDNIFSDIGDEQSIEQSLSTFSSHMTNIISIEKQLSDSCLVLIDELGAGTDPIEGAALATAILESFHYKGAKIAATTHYAELKSYALNTPRVQNAGCEFDVQSLKPTYRLLIGAPGRSNAFAISSRLGMGDNIISRAKELVSGQDTSFENTLAELERARQEYEDKSARADSLIAKARLETEKAEQIKASAEALRDKEVEKGKAQATKMIEQATRRANALVMELEQIKKRSEDMVQSTELYRQGKSLVKRTGLALSEITKTQTVPDEEYVLPRPLKLGDIVVLADTGETGELKALANKKGMCEVLVGSFKIKVSEKKLRLTDKTKVPQKKTEARRTEHVFRPADGGTGEVDLRGMTVDEGISVVDKQIDICMRQGLTTLNIIHGKGTGALRAGIQSFLKGHKLVKSYRLGNMGEGDSGVTVATLKSGL